MNNLKLYVTEQDYMIVAGADWPRYQDFLLGDRGAGAIKEEVVRFVEQAHRTGIKFPINTPTACQSKWTWSTIYLNKMSTSSCHRVNLIPLDPNNFANFHNMPKKLEDRRMMLRGEWPTGGCEQCRVVEQAGGWSDRLHNLDIRGLTPPELETDSQAVEVTPRIVEIMAQNTCNLACVYCNDNLSSRIQQENIKFGAFSKDGVTIPITDIPGEAARGVFDQFLAWLEDNVQSLKRLHLLGGETFLQHELMGKVLGILARKPNPALQLNIFSNFNVPLKFWHLYTSQIKELQQAGNIEYFDLTASIDCWGTEQEYVRSGLNLKQFEQYFAWAAEQDNWLRLNVNQTITSMTIRTMPELIKKIDHYSQHRHIGHYFQFAVGETDLHPGHFSYKLWEDDFKQILAAMPNRTIHQQEAIPRMIGMQRQLEQATAHNYEKIRRLHIYLDELDRRRGTNWRDLFPYLDIRE
jgi:hypothetical protein